LPVVRVYARHLNLLKRITMRCYSGAQEFASKADLRERKAEIMGERKLNRWTLTALIGLAMTNFAKPF
jgi:hypothetical protein